jgi:hypothetical protein
MPYRQPIEAATPWKAAGDQWARSGQRLPQTVHVVGLVGRGILGGACWPVGSGITWCCPGAEQERQRRLGERGGLTRGPRGVEERRGPLTDGSNRQSG